MSEQFKQEESQDQEAVITNAIEVQDETKGIKAIVNATKRFGKKHRRAIMFTTIAIAAATSGIVALGFKEKKTDISTEIIDGSFEEVHEATAEMVDTPTTTEVEA